MTNIRSPRYTAADTGRSRECENVCASAITDVVRRAVAAGWREEEIALHLADAAENYVIYLATKPDRKLRAANNN
ncbi:hypothetical protein A6U87_24435 [Rhizobium sp. AC44/96]|jgi:hypothetical protein|uniref:hypothetical protein n=1 Tax=Rhizobium sp. S96 TaxID=3055140 RepID=UPI00080FB7B3|nr:MULTISPECIES: hypothetical protein [unclassified Rhizobium]MDM9622606.1 hypothetical protein [Rhizobium sp. S96]OCJ14996.1 hypothetical protein A6U87_24435 [Rhizobium sp. AC44/96]